MNSYFAYTRVSTVKQGERGSSLQEQKSAIEAYAAKHSLRIIGWYEEMETAAKLGRRMFNRMLGDLETGRARGVIIHKIDRSARNLKDWAHLGELIDRGVEVHFAHESLDLASRGGRLSADIQAVVAADYIRNLRQEVKKGFYGRLKQGFYPLPAPMGYVDQGKARHKTIDPMRGPLVREMFELYATGQWPLHDLRREMLRRGLTARGGKSLSLATVARTLHNPFYFGLIRVFRTGETFQGAHQRLITKATFDRVQAVLVGKAVPRVFTHQFTYRRLVRCARCGYALIAERQKGRVYYRCHSQACRGTSLREDVIDREVRCFLNLVSLSDEELGILRSLGEQGQGERTRSAEERRQQTQRALGLCEDRLVRLTDAFLDGDVDKATYEERKAKLLSDRAELRDDLGRPDLADPLNQILADLELGNGAQQGRETISPEEMRTTVELITSNLTADGKELAIEPQFPFSTVAEWRISLNGAPCWTRPRIADPQSGSDAFSTLAKRCADLGECVQNEMAALLDQLVSNVPQVPNHRLVHARTEAHRTP